MIEASASKPLDEIIAAWQNRPFVRGESDCCAFADYVLQETTGRSFLPLYRGDDGAAKILERYGSLSEAVTFYLHREPVGATALRPGDVCLIDIASYQAVGIVTEVGAATVFENGVLRPVRREFIDHGWRIWESKLRSWR